MSKLILAAGRWGIYIDAYVFLWNAADPDVYDYAEYRGRMADDWGLPAPSEPGLWVFEGEDEDGQWRGSYRRPTVYELHEIVAGRWPKERNGP